jgi:hypothetical protein
MANNNISTKLLIISIQLCYLAYQGYRNANCCEFVYRRDNYLLTYNYCVWWHRELRRIIIMLVLNVISWIVGSRLLRAQCKFIIVHMTSKQTANKKKPLPLQSTPSPVKPSWHSQVKEPVVLVQVALAWQLWSAVEHSLISKMFHQIFQ